MSEPVHHTSSLKMWSLAARAHTPARLFDNGAFGSNSTAQSLALRADHAVARDAVTSVLSNTPEAFGEALVLRSRASDRWEYLRDPELGRRLADRSRDALVGRPRMDYNVQVIVGEGLSAAAIQRQAPVVMAGLRLQARVRGWRLAPLLLVEQCRVGILNDVGELTGIPMLILLIGERPGLATADSMSAYFAWRPSRESNDADRNLISNIHDRGLPANEAVGRIADLADLIRGLGLSGFEVKELSRATQPRADPPPDPSALLGTPRT